MISRQGITFELYKWIFAIVAGAVILMFFVRFAFQHIDTSEKVNDFAFTEHFEDQLDAFGVAEDSKKTFSYPEEKEIFFTCEGFGSGAAFLRTPKLLFSSDSLHGSQIAAWAQEWKFPYAVSSLYYLTNKEQRIILVYDDASAEFVQSLAVPSSFSVLKISKQQLNLQKLKSETQTLSHLHIVYFTPVADPLAIITSFSLPTFVTVVRLEDYTLHFYPEGTTSFFVDTPMLLGALFAPSLYSCLLDKTLERHHAATLLYERKMQFLQAKFLGTSCEARIASAIQTLHAFSAAEDLPTLLQYAEAIDQENAQLERNDCPPIY